MTDNKNSTERIVVQIADDRMKAWVQLAGVKQPDYKPPDVPEVLSGLKNANLAVAENVKKRVEELVLQWNTAHGAGQELSTEPVLVAEGTPAVNATDGSFEWAPELEEAMHTPSEDEDHVDYFSVNAIVTVDAGKPIGRIVAPVDGTPSVNVHGEERPPRKPKGVAIKLGPGVTFANDQGDVVAEIAGRVVLQNDKLRVDEVLEIPGDVDFSSGSVDACVNVAVRGNVRSNFHVYTTKSLTVERVIEAADVRVDGDVCVRGGIFGDGAGRVLSGGGVSAQLLNEVRVKAKGDVLFVKEILNSQVYTSGKLVGERGTIIGGEVHAREGVNVRTIGSEASVATIVSTGIDVNTLRRVRQKENQVREARKSADQLREAVQPLIANLKRLLPAQRERATELICKADELDLEVSELEESAKQMHEDCKPTDKPQIEVADRVHPGTHLIVSCREVRVQKEIHGPVKIEERKVNDATEVVAVNQRTGSVTVLHSVDADLDAAPTDDWDTEEQSEEATAETPNGSSK